MIELLPFWIHVVTIIFQLLVILQDSSTVNKTLSLSRCPNLVSYVLFKLFDCKLEYQDKLQEAALH